MGKLAKASNTIAVPPIDWAKLKRDIVDGLDIAAEYSLLGIRWADGAPNPKGWRDCHSVDRKDDSPSAGVKILPGDAAHGVYSDHGGDQLTTGFLEFALKFGRFGTWMEVVKHYADKAGVQVGRAEFSGQKILENVYSYHQADASVSYAVFRYRLPNGKKDFRQFPWRNGEWIKEKGCMEGVQPLPYRLGAMAESNPEDTIFIVEGEKDADRLASEGLIATTNHQGSKSTDTTWPRDSFLPHFKGRDVIVLPDNDDPGRKHAHRVCWWLKPIASRVRYLELPGLGYKGDASDWLDSGHTIEDLGRLAHRAIDWTPDLCETKESSNAVIAPEVDFDPSDIVLVKMSSIKPKLVEWLVPNKIPLGKLTLIAGKGGLGKSFVTMDLAARLSVGGEIPGACGEAFESPASSLLFFAEDGAEDTVVPRLIAAGADLDKIQTLESIRDSTGRLTAFNLTYIDHLDYALSRIPDCKLIVIDPVPNYIGRDADDHRNAEIRQVLTPLAKLAEKRNVAIVMITHVTKGSSASAANRVMGSGAYVNLCRASWMVLEDPDDSTKRLIVSIKNNLAPANDGLSYRILDGRIVWGSDPIEQSANDVISKESSETSRFNGGGGGRPKKSPEACAEWVRTYLFDRGPTLSAKVFEDGKVAGFGRDQLYQIKETAGVRVRKDGFGKDAPWQWFLDNAGGHAITVPFGSAAF